MRLLFGFLFICLITACSGCAIKTVKTVEIGYVAGYANKALIATRDSEFKNAVVSEIVEALRNDATYLKIIDVKKLQNESTRDYDAVVIVDTCMAWSLSRRVRSYLAGVDEREKVILLATAKGEDCGPEPLDVDSITSASKMNKVRVIATSIVEKVRLLFASGY